MLILGELVEINISTILTANQNLVRFIMWIKGYVQNLHLGYFFLLLYLEISHSHSIIHWMVYVIHDYNTFVAADKEEIFIIASTICFFIRYFIHCRHLQWFEVIILIILCCSKHLNQFLILIVKIFIPLFPLIFRMHGSLFSSLRPSSIANFSII